MDGKFETARALASVARKNLWKQFQDNPNFVGTGFGRKTVNGTVEETPALVVYVMKKLAPEFVPLQELIPKVQYVGSSPIDVDVVETGPFYTSAFTYRERPAPSGISIGALSTTAGTLGCLVLDKIDGKLCILSNNHVLVNNHPTLHDPIVQPGPFDGGTASNDAIAYLRRFVPIDPQGINYMDCAVATVEEPVASNIIDQMKNNMMPTPSPTNPAVGLLFAGCPTRTLINPIAPVLFALGVSFFQPGSVVDANLAMDVWKVGRTTELTTGLILEVDGDLRVNGPWGLVRFRNQICASAMSQGGDSGSIVCRLSP